MKKHWKLLAGLCLLVVTSGCSASKPQPTVQPQQPVQQTAQTTTVNGKDIYDRKCAGCHGSEGKGGSASKLNTSEWNSTVKVADIVKAGKGGMPAYQGRMKDEEIKAVSDYVAALPKTGK